MTRDPKRRARLLAAGGVPVLVLAAGGELAIFPVAVPGAVPGAAMHGLALAVVAALSALSAPSFTPIQQAVLYGYRSGVVNVAVRWGWVLAPFGLGLAAAIRWG